MSYPNPNPTQIPESESEPDGTPEAQAQWWKTLPVSVIMFLMAMGCFLALGGALLGAAWLMALASFIFFMVVMLILVR